MKLTNYKSNGTSAYKTPIKYIFSVFNVRIQHSWYRWWWTSKFLQLQRNWTICVNSLIYQKSSMKKMPVAESATLKPTCRKNFTFDVHNYFLLCSRSVDNQRILYFTIYISVYELLMVFVHGNTKTSCKNAVLVWRNSVHAFDCSFGVSRCSRLVTKFLKN